MCGKPKIIEDVQKSTDKAIKDTQKAADSAIDQIQSAADSAIGNTGGSSVNWDQTSFSDFLRNFNKPQDLAAPVVQAVEEVAKPVEQVAQTAVQAVTPVVESVVDVAKVPVQAVEQITKIDAPKVVESVAKETILAPVKAAETVVKAAEPVAQAAAQVVQQPVKAVEEIAKIDVPKVVENVVKQAATTVTETPKMVVEIAENAVLKPASNLSMYLTEEAKDASELLWNNIIDPFQPGETQGTEGGGTDPALDANTPNLGDDQVFSDLETATGKGSQMSEEERLRRIRRLLTNRYGREKTILGGAGDTTSRRRYAV